MTEAGNEIRAAAVAADDGSGLYRVLLVNFNYDFTGGSKETVRLKLDRLPLRDGKLEATAYVIDEKNNNWWRLWKEYREENGIEYRHSDGVTHLGKMLEIDEKYVDNHLYVKVTTDAEGYRAWLKKLPEYHAIDGLQPTSEGTLDVRGGTAVLNVPMRANATLYLELRVPEAARPEPLKLSGKNWETSDGTEAADGGELRIVPRSGNATGAELKLTGLVPKAGYVWSFIAESPVRMVDLQASVSPGRGSKRSSAWMDYDGVPQRLVLSGTASADGELTLRLEAPPQPWEAADQLIIRNQELRKIEAH
jgi:hypothetical protein